MIELNGVTRQFVLEGGTTVVPVRDVTLDIAAGEFIIVTGLSGGGKTTLLRILAGLLKPTSGEVRIGGRDIGRMPEAGLARFRARCMGFVVQSPSLLPSLTVLANVLLPAGLCGMRVQDEQRQRAVNLLERVGLHERLGCYPAQLSAGEQRRAVLARALMNDPDILLADEPTADLDEHTEHEVMAHIREAHAGGATVVMVTHNLELLSNAHRVLRMENGRLYDLIVPRTSARTSPIVLNEMPVTRTTFAQ